MRRQRHRTRASNNKEPNNINAISNVPPSAIVYQTGIDVNTNIGEGYGPYRIAGEGEILPFVTSANIACGAHSGDPVIMESALEETRYYGLTLGAHIGYPDLAGFGRREMHLAPTELRTSILYQLGALSGLARTLGFDITQVRPHGFLYRQMMSDLRIALIVARAVAEFDKWLVLIGPAGPTLMSAGERAGLRIAGEAWIDRVYDPTGHLLPHSHSRSQIKNPQEILRQANQLICQGTVTSSEGTTIKIDFQTLHVHPNIASAKLVCEQLRSLIPYACSLTCEPYNIDNETETENLYLTYSE